MKEAGLFPHTSQSGSAFKGRSADTAAEEADADTDADADADAETGADADAGAGAGAGASGVVGDVAEVDGPVVVLGCFPPFFFVMGWCVGLFRSSTSSSRLCSVLVGLCGSSFTSVVWFPLKTKSFFLPSVVSGSFRILPFFLAGTWHHS